MSTRKIIVLGTSSQVPTRHRNHNGYLVIWDDEGFLFDPGEGTQRQMTFAKAAVSSITKIFITHFHGDHCLGLAGIIQRLSLDRVKHTVKIFYPASGQVYFNNLKNASIFYNVAKIEECPISETGVIFENEKILIEAYKLEHSVDTLGYRIKEKDTYTMLPEKLSEYGIKGALISQLKRNGNINIDGYNVSVHSVSNLKEGQSIAFVMDTRVCDNAFLLAKNVDILICESTYLSSEEEDAHAHYHLTATQAGKIAYDSGAKKLLLTHFSQRYEKLEPFVTEAKQYHNDVMAVQDGDEINIYQAPRNI